MSFTQHPAPSTQNPLLLSGFCLLVLLAGCGARGGGERRISPDTARRELFLRGQSYKPEVFLDRAGDGDHIAVRLFLIAGMSPE
ncbi:MAG: hypothetical protein M3416_18960, partial [Acidobacteriota bacterium]|nr:hypothetical protein [Acidobacteriota bacterium]